MKTTRTSPLEPIADVAEVYSVASKLFCQGKFCALQAVALARRHGVGPVLRALRAESDRAERSGSWGRWGVFLASLEPLGGPLSDPRDRRRRIPRRDAPTRHGGV